MAGTMGLSKVLDEAEIETLSDAIREKLESRLQGLQTQTDELKSKYEKVCVNSGNILPAIWPKFRAHLDFDRY